MPDSLGSKVHLTYLLLMANLNNIRNYSWGQLYWLLCIVCSIMKYTLIRIILEVACCFYSVGHGNA